METKISQKTIALCALLSVCLSCSPTSGPDKTVAGAVLGAGWGAGLGAAIGNQTDDVGAGAGVGAGFGLVSGALTGAGLDYAESTQLKQQREMDALKIQLAANNQRLTGLQDALDLRDQKIRSSSLTEKVFFDEDKTVLRSGAVARLERLANNVKLNPYFGRVEVHGHSDEIGDEEREMLLSEYRARRVATFLSEHGISQDQLAILPHGAKEPVASNDTASGKQLNRRVEIVVLK